MKKKLVSAWNRYKYSSAFKWCRIMKLSVFLMLLGVLNVYSIPTVSQNTMVSINLQQVSVKQVLNELEAKTEFSFLYNDELIDVERIVSVEAKNSDLFEVMDQLFYNSDVQFQFVEQRIILSKREQNITRLPQEVTHNVSGIVRDVQGEPIPGVNVFEINDMSNGVITGIDGSFTVTLKNSESELQFSFIGFESQVVKVAGRETVNIVLVENNTDLDEVVVVGYGIQKRANLTGAVASIKTEEILGERPIHNIAQAMQGNVSGLQITNANGKPGSGLSMNIRGTTSINGGSPLVLVDNVPMDISLLNPDDIESVSVLKDAASSAIYGARAAFGVILVTTKKSDKDSKPRFTYSNNFAFSTPFDLPQKAGVNDVVKYLKDAEYQTYWSGQQIDIWEQVLEDNALNPNRDGYVEIDGIRYYTRDNDEIGDMFDNYGFKQNHNLAYSGSSKGISYRVSLGIVDEDGAMASNKDTYKRYNVSNYLGVNLTKWWKAEMDLKYIADDSKEPYVRPANGGGDNLIYKSTITRPAYNPVGFTEFNGELLPYDNALNFINGAGFKNNSSNNFRWLARSKFEITKDINVTGEYTFNRIDIKKVTYDKKMKFIQGVGNKVDYTTLNSNYRVINEQQEREAVNIYGNINKVYGDHSLNLMVGYNQEFYHRENIDADINEMINDNYPSFSQAVGIRNVDDLLKEYSLRSGFYRFNYDYKGKYLLETNGRYDGSSKFPKDTRFGFFPSVSVGYRISEEAFMDWSKSVVSNFKLRASYGTIGNQSVDPYLYIVGMPGKTANWIVDGKLSQTLVNPNLVSGDLTWETVKTLDYGVDLGLFNNRLDAVFDWYRRDTEGMLTQQEELPSVLGKPAPKTNAADLRAYGWELSLKWNHNVNKDLSYYLGFNIHDAQSKITKYKNVAGLFHEELKPANPRYREGMMLGEIWGYTTDRYFTEADFDADGNLLDVYADQTRVGGAVLKPGDIKYANINGDEEISPGDNTVDNPGDLSIIGNSTRRYQYGINAGVKFKGVRLSCILQGVGKRDLWLSNPLFWPHQGTWSTVYEHQMNYWTDDNVTAYYARPGETDNAKNQKIQTKYLQNGAYLKLRNVTLSYDIPKAWAEKVHLGKAMIYVSGENLYTWHHLPDGIDPEMGNDGSGWTYPYMRYLSFGVNVSF